MWDLTVSVPDHCLSFYSADHDSPTKGKASITELIKEISENKFSKNIRISYIAIKYNQQIT